MLGKVGS